MRKEKILIIDDDLLTIKYVRASLKANDYETFAALDGEEGIQIIERELPDIILLDIMMPKLDGFAVLEKLQEWSKIPVIMVSARGDEVDKVRCLDLGADDYLSKPFGIEELLARIRAVLRRTTASEVIKQASIVCDELEINFAQRKVTVSGEEIKLTSTEYSLLQELVLNAGKVLTHTYLLNKVWGVEYMEERHYLHVFIRRLRRKIEPDKTEPRYILSVSGVGYQFQHV